MFVNRHDPVSDMMHQGLIKLAKHYNGDIQFGWVAFSYNEKLRMTFNVYDHHVPRAFYIDTEGVAYAFPHIMPSFNKTSDWIDDGWYKTKSPYIAKAPPLLDDVRLIIGNVKKEVRKWYAENLRDIIEPYIRQVKFTYLVDMDPTDFENIKFGQKTDRQILFIIAGIVWIGEGLWDLLFPAPAEQKKKKSIISTSKNDVKPPPAEKKKRDKIE